MENYKVSMVVTSKETEKRPQMVVLETPNNPLRMEDLLRTRKTYRLFLDKPVEEEKKGRILEMFESSQVEIETNYGKLHRFWGYKVVEKKEDRERIFNEAVFSRAASAVKSRAFDEMLNAPMHVIVYLKTNQIEKEFKEDSERKSVFWKAVDDSSVSSSASALIAHELGLAGWWIGHMREGKLAEVAGLPKGSQPIILMVFGYPRTDEKESRILSEAGRTFGKGARPEQIYFEEEFGKVFSRVGEMSIEKKLLIRFNDIPMFQRGIEKQIEVISEKASENEREKMDRIRMDISKLITEDRSGLNEKVNEQLKELFVIVNEVRKRAT